MNLQGVVGWQIKINLNFTPYADIGLVAVGVDVTSDQFPSRINLGHEVQITKKCAWSILS